MPMHSNNVHPNIVHLNIVHPNAPQHGAPQCIPTWHWWGGMGEGAQGVCKDEA